MRKIDVDDIWKRTEVSKFLSPTGYKFWIRKGQEPAKAKKHLDSLRVKLQEWVDEVNND